MKRLLVRAALGVNGICSEWIFGLCAEATELTSEVHTGKKLHYPS